MITGTGRVSDSSVANAFGIYGSLFKEYYSDHIIFTPHARNNWILPDKKQLIE